MSWFFITRNRYKKINLQIKEIPLEVINRVNERMVSTIEENHNREIHAYNTNSELSKVLTKKFSK